MAGYETVLAALGDDATTVYGGRVVARCPAHDDDRPSLSLKEGEDGRALLFCHAGCATTDVVAALDLSMSDLFARGTGDGRATQVDHYTYRDEEGNPLIRVIRTDPKGFFQERWEEGEWKPGLRDTRRVLYNLPAVLTAAAQGDTVYVVEGEKDADNITAQGDVATTALGGAGKWSDDYTQALKGARVIVVADQDEPGLKHAAEVAAATGGTVVTPATGKDVTDHLLAGFKMSELRVADLEDTFEEWDPWEYEVPETEWLLKPYVGRGWGVLLHGASGSLKSLWAMWLAVKVAESGEKVAYVSSEMNKGMTAKRFKRFGKPPTLKVYGRMMLGQDLGRAIKAWEGYALVVVDSWSSAQGSTSSNDNDAISALHVEFIRPFIESTGATLMLIDNTGHDAITKEGTVRRTTARGASRKRDIMDTEMQFSRPDPRNNYRTAIEVNKVRDDYSAPAKTVIETGQGDIEFYYVDQGVMSMRPMWPGLQDTESEMTESEREAFALLSDMLGGGNSE